MIAHSLDELITAVLELSDRVAAIDGRAPVLDRPDAPAFVDTDTSLHDSVEDLKMRFAQIENASGIDWSPVQSRINELEQIIRTTNPVAVVAAPSTELEQRVAAIEHVVKALRQARDATPLVPVIPEDHGARIAALEQHATASGGMVEALSMVMELARESDARSAKLEAEAIEIGRAFSTVMSVIQPVLRKRA